MAFSIDELSVHTRVNPSTIRYYERQGVLPAPMQSETGTREYHDVDVGRVLFVRNTRYLKMELDEIRALVEMIGEGNSEEIEVVERDLIERIARLERFRADLRVVSETMRAGEIDETGAFCLLAGNEGAKLKKQMMDDGEKKIHINEKASTSSHSAPIVRRKRAKS